MTITATAPAPTDAAKFSQFEPLIARYNEAKWAQIRDFDASFLELCRSKIPSDAELDAEPVDARQFVTCAGLLSGLEAQIVNEFTIPELLQKQLSRELSAEQIARAYIKSAIVAQLATNCVMQFLIPSALERAKQLDAHLHATGQLLGPMHGIPISLKEQMGYKGQVTCASYASLIENVVKKSSVSIQIFDKLGAVFHVRTSQPQTIMHLDTWNNVIGRTRNPCSTTLSPGGSSGGESAMVAMHGSAIGIGSDIGGSIRCPAAFTGVYGLRPTTKRLSSMNGVSGGKGQESVPSTEGPIARSIDELEYFMDCYINQGKPWEYDPTSLVIPWRPAQLPDARKLRVGVLYHDNLVTPFPAVQRALRQVVSQLAPHFDIVDLADSWFSEPEMLDIHNATLSLYTIDGNRTQQDLLTPSGEPILPLTNHFLHFGGGKELSVYDNRRLNMLRDATRLAVFEKFFSAAPASLNLDFILSPTYPAPAELPAQSFYWGYTSVWNLTDYPNAVFPTPYAHDAQVDTQAPEQLRDNEFEQSTWAHHDPAAYRGGPVGLQLTGKRFSDENVVAAVKKIAGVLQLSRK